MIPIEKVVTGYKRNSWIINKQVEGLSDEDGLLQLPFRGNCLNWVLAHVIVYRDEVINAFGEEGFLTPEQVARYEYDSEPVTEMGEHIIPLTKQVDIFNKQDELMLRLIEEAEEAKLNEEVDYAGTTGPIWDMVFYFYFHDTYHTGQFEYLRQLAGKDDKVI